MLPPKGPPLRTVRVSAGPLGTLQPQALHTIGAQRLLVGGPDRGPRGGGLESGRSSSGYSATAAPKAAQA